MPADMYMKIDRASGTVVGEVTDSDHVGWMEIQSFNHAQTQAINPSQSGAGGRTAERVFHSDFTVSKYMDKSAPVLNLACSEGEHFKTITVELWRATDSGNKPIKYMEYILTDALISNYSVGGGGGGMPSESISFNYNTIKWSYIPMKQDAQGGPDAAIPAGWSLKENKSI